MISGGRVRLTAGGRALRHRNFRLFFYSQLVSLIGTWMQSLAQQWLMLTLVGPREAPFYLGLLGVMQFLPVMVLGLFGGIIADLWPKRHTIIATQTLSGLLAVILAALVYTGTVQVWEVFALGFALGCVNAVDMPTRQSFVVEMVGREDVANAVALNSAVFNSARIFGPALGGLLIERVGTATCFLLNGLSFGAVVFALFFMRDAELMPADRLVMERTVGAVVENVKAGIAYVRETPIVLLAISVIGLVSMFGMNFNVLMPLVATSILHSGAAELGFLNAALGVGAVISALTVASLPRPSVRVLLGGAALMGLAEVGLAWTSSIDVALIAVFLTGLGAISMAATANSLVQVTVPGHLRGRVMSVYTTIFVGSSPAGNALTGATAGIWGVPAAAFMNGAGALVVAGIAAVAVLAGRVPTVGRGRRVEPTPEEAMAQRVGEQVVTPLGK